jgi:hypothetical protein
LLQFHFDFSLRKINKLFSAFNEQVIQLKHDLANKNGLIQMYSEHESDEVDTPEPRDKTCLLVNWKSLHEKIVRLEDENGSLRREAVYTSKEIEIEEKRELMLIRDCAKQLSKFSRGILRILDLSLCAVRLLSPS